MLLVLWVIFTNIYILLCFEIFEQVRVNTVLGSNAPPLTVKLVRASISGSKDISIESQVS